MSNDPKEIVIIPESNEDFAIFSEHLRSLHHLTTREYFDQDEMLHDYLQVGCYLFGFETGIISAINNNSYRIIAVRSPLEELTVGMVFELEDTYCANVVSKRGTIDMINIGDDPEMCKHPVYQNLKLECYLGIPIFVDHEIFGTLNFTSQSRRNLDVAWYDIEMGEMMAQTLGKIIEVKQASNKQLDLQQQLESAKVEAELTLASISDVILKVDKQGKLEYLNAAAERMFGLQTGAHPDNLNGLFSLELDGEDVSLMGLVNDCIKTKMAISFLKMDVKTQLTSTLYHIKLALTPITTNGDDYETVVITMHDLTDLMMVAEKLEFRASHDALTGLPNRNLMHDRIKQQITYAERNKQQFAVLFLDIDGFKPINDNLGHDAGDSLLRNIANRLRASVRASDTVARFGGDEFVLLLNDIKEKQDVITVISKIIDKLCSPIEINKHVINIGASIGAACYPEHGTDSDALVIAADEAMYNAKRDPQRAYFFSGEI